eukprot:11506897-Heterocapsa_arctica.AAC.1
MALLTPLVKYICLSDLPAAEFYLAFKAAVDGGLEMPNEILQVCVSRKVAECVVEKNWMALLQVLGCCKAEAAQPKKVRKLIPCDSVASDESQSPLKPDKLDETLTLSLFAGRAAEETALFQQRT